MPKLIFKKWWNKEDIFLILDDWEFRAIWYMKNWKYYIKRDKDRHYFEYYKGYWYNKQLLDSLPNETIVVLKLKWNPRLCYITTVGAIIEHNQVYKKEWYELQYVFPFESMTIDLRSIQK
jgi:hypothetical protein